MIQNKLVALYINALTLDEGIAMAKNYGINFTKEEGKILLPFLKQNRYDLTLENKENLLSQIKKIVEPTTFAKITKFLDSLIQ